MAQVELLLPKMGESVAEATIVKWLKNPGDRIEEDDAVLDVATDKVDSEVPSPVSGKLIKHLCQENDVVQVGTPIAIIDTGGSEPEPIRQSSGQPVQSRPEPVENQEPAKQPRQEVKASATGRFYSPLVKNIAAEEGISVAELDNIQGSGSDGRVNREDLMAYISEKKGSKESKNTMAAVPAAPQNREERMPAQEQEAIEETQPAPRPAPIQQPPARQAPVQQDRPAAKAPQPVSAGTTSSGNDEIIEMDRMRRIIADHMIMSVQTSPHVTSFVEADVTNMVKWRERVKGNFERREGDKITFTPLFIEAVAKAIKDMPMVNVSVDGNRIIKKRDINIGLAAALPSGNLIVPVIKNADQLNLVGLSKAVNDLAQRARSNKLKPDEIKDGTFTITNIGTFGNIMGTPIINQPQVAILAIGVIKKKPAVIEGPDGDMIGIRHMTYLSLSYDHRVVDGGLGGSFLRRIADYLEGWDGEREI